MINLKSWVVLTVLAVLASSLASAKGISELKSDIYRKYGFFIHKAWVSKDDDPLSNAGFKFF